MFGAKSFAGVGFPTPALIPVDMACRMFSIPGSAAWLGTFMGLLSLLADPDNWQQFEGGIDRETAASIWQDVIDSGYDSASTGQDACAGRNTSPFWDDADAQDADGSPDDNTYTWENRIEDWAIAAFIASAGVPGAAATYLTIAPRFRLLFKRGDTGGIAKIFIDDVLQFEVDTYSPTPDVMFADVVIP